MSMDTVGATSFAKPGDRALEITRAFEVRRQVVFDAFTTCDAVRWWMGPAGWTIGGCEIDLRPGGAYRIGMKSPDGYEVPGGGTCEAVSAPELLVTNQDYGAGATRHTLRLAEDGGRTTMTYTVEYPSTEMRDAASAMPLKEAMDQGYDRLAEYLASAG